MLEKVAEPIKISLAAARVNARKTQAQLAEEMEISRMTLANLENGKTQISKAQLHLFCELCNIPVANIFLPYKFSEWKYLSIQGGERVIEHKTYKYIIRSYEPFMEERTKTFIQALSAIKKMKLSGIKHYEVIRIPFRERHPNFPIYFSIVVLVIAMLSG